MGMPWGVMVLRRPERRENMIGAFYESVLSALHIL